MNTIYHMLDHVYYKNEYDFNVLKESILYDEIIDNDDYYTESAKSPIKKFFQNIIKKIKEIIKNVKDTIAKLFKSKQYKNTMDKLNDAIKATPSIKNKKLKIKKYKEMKKLNKEMFSRIKKASSSSELNETMKRYRKVRNAIIGTGAAAVATVTVAGIIATLSNKSDDSPFKELDDIEKLSTDTLTELNATSEQIEQKTVNTPKETHKPSANNAIPKTWSKEFNKTIMLNKEKASAVVEITKNANSDAVEETHNILREITLGGVFLGVTDNTGKVIKTDEKNPNKLARDSNGNFIYDDITADELRKEHVDKITYQREKEKAEKERKEKERLEREEIERREKAEKERKEKEEAEKIKKAESERRWKEFSHAFEQAEKEEAEKRGISVEKLRELKLEEHERRRKKELDELVRKIQHEKDIERLRLREGGGRMM